VLKVMGAAKAGCGSELFLDFFSVFGGLLRISADFF
jgi:hypothetical protein